MEQQDLHEQIEAYLSGTLPPEERQAWQRRLSEDAELRREVELHRQLQQDYDGGRLQLRANLREIMNEPLPPDTPPVSGGNRRWGWWTGLIGCLLVAALAVWFFQKTAPAVPETPPAETPVAPPASAPEKAPSVPDSAVPKPARPIAAADPARFKPNPGMEAFVNGGVRSSGIEINITRPANGKRFMPDEKGAFTVRFSGTGNWPADKRPKGFSLLFFDNLDANRPLLTVPIQAQKDIVESLTFDMRQPLKFPPGLYYFTVEENDLGEILYAGKFFVGK